MKNKKYHSDKSKLYSRGNNSSENTNKGNVFVYIWQFIFFNTTSFGLMFLLLNNGWSPITYSNIGITGKTKLEANSILAALGLNREDSLLGINPKSIKENVFTKLPSKVISVNRNILANNLEIKITDREIIAFGRKKEYKETVTGLIDIDGYWIPIKPINSTVKPLEDIYVEGWDPTYREVISVLLKQRRKIGSNLERIVITPNGEINLQTNLFETISLGRKKKHLPKQISALAELSRSLPKRFANQPGTTLDIRDPSKPELQMATPIKTP